MILKTVHATGINIEIVVNDTRSITEMINIIPFNLDRYDRTTVAKNGNYVNHSGLLRCNGHTCKTCPFSTVDFECKTAVIKYLKDDLAELKLTHPEHFI